MPAAINYTSFAIVGAGRVGKLVVNALASKPSSSITILSRSERSDPAHPGNVKVVAVNYDDKAAIVSTLKANKVQVVIDTTKVPGKEFHIKLADASKEAGIGLFVPSEWGDVSCEGPAAWKVHVPFIECLPWLGNTEDGKFHILGKGDTPVTATSMQDAADFLAHILTTLPPSELANTIYRLQGDRGTLKQFASRLKLPVVFHTDKIPGEGSTTEFRTFLQKQMEEGKGGTGWDIENRVDDEELAGSGNKFWEGHCWKAVEEIHRE